MQHLADGQRSLSTIERSIQLENRLALQRRWRVAQDLAGLHPKTLRRLFPGQDELLDLLARSTEKDVERISQVSVPLFGVSIDLLCPPQDLVVGALNRTHDSLEQGSFDEVWQALTARLDAIRQSPEGAQVAYHLSRASVRRLSGYNSMELRYASQQPLMCLAPLVRPEFFLAAVFGAYRGSFGLAQLATLQRSQSPIGVVA